MWVFWGRSVQSCVEIFGYKSLILWGSNSNHCESISYAMSKWEVVDWLEVTVDDPVSIQRSVARVIKPSGAYSICLLVQLSVFCSTCLLVHLSMFSSTCYLVLQSLWKRWVAVGTEVSLGARIKSLTGFSMLYLMFCCNTPFSFLNFLPSLHLYNCVP